MPSAARKKTATVPEIRLLRAAWHRGALVASLALVGVGLGYLWSEYSVKTYRAQAEILVRYGYEYTPQNAGAGSDSMQVRIDADLALNSDVQILLSPPVVEAALHAAPYPTAVDDKTGKQQIGFEQAAMKLSVARIEGTNVITMAVLDRHRDWAQDFATALIDAYLARRDELFSSDRQSRFLLAKRAELRQALEDVNTQSVAASSVLMAAGDPASNDSLRLWATSGIDLIEALKRAGETAASLPGDHGTKLPVDPKITLVGRLLGEILTDAAPEAEGSSEPAPRSPVPEEDDSPAPIAGKAAQINEMVDQAAQLDRQRQMLLASLGSVEERLQAIEFRRAQNEGVVVMTPPYVSGRSVGISASQKIAFSGILGLMLGLFLAVVLEGNRRTASRKA